VLLTKIKNYINQTEDPAVNFELGYAYESIGQIASAVSFYLRSAERTNDISFQYKLLLRLAICFQKLGERIHTEQTLIHKALALLPKQPEAYFLASKLYERKHDWQECYTYASLGLDHANFNLPVIDVGNGYLGKVSLLFQKGLSSWYTGLTDQAQEIMADLKFNFDLDSEYASIVDNNLSFIGYPATTTVYRSDMQQYLRYQFSDVSLIDKNFAQSYQDIFVLMATNGKKLGTYLEIGSDDPYINSNTALLETKFGWQGISIDIKSDAVENFKNQRKNPVYCIDARYVNYTDLLKQSNFPQVIDYLQVDCEPPEVTFEILKKLPFDQYKFSIITFEHDAYKGDVSVRDQSREFLKSKGYELIVSDLAFTKKYSYEDWWVHPDLISLDHRAILRDISNDGKSCQDYIFYKKTLTQTFNNNQRNGFWVVDNFYADPDAVRDFALKQEYHQGGLGRGYIGRRTLQKFLFPGLKKEFERIMGQPIIAWEEHEMNGRFQYSMEGEPLVYHCDLQKWAAMIYLTPDAPLETGTGSFALKNTKIFHSSQEGIIAAFRGDGAQNLDKTIFEPVDAIGNVYNRLVIFNAGYLHAALGYFGYKPENARLWQMFFFD
jgi:tetratricopeptide (TPR) repeat protein